MIPNNLQTAVEDVLYSIQTEERKTRRHMVTGGLIFAISLFAMKCDMTTTYVRVNEKINAVMEKHESLDERIRKNEQGIQELLEGGYIRQPCYDQKSPNVVGVGPC